MKPSEELRDIWDLLEEIGEKPEFFSSDGFQSWFMTGAERIEIEESAGPYTGRFLIPKNVNERLRIIIDYDPHTVHTLIRYFTAPGSALKELPSWNERYLFDPKEIQPRENWTESSSPDEQHKG